MGRHGPLWKRTEEKIITPETAKILVDGLFRIVGLGGVILCIYAFIKGLFGGYRR